MCGDRGAIDLALASMVAVGGVSAQGRINGPLGELDVLAHEEWRGEGPGFRTKLTYRWLFDGRMLEAANEVLNEEGGVIARYHGAYAWDEGRGERALHRRNGAPLHGRRQVRLVTT